MSRAQLALRRGQPEAAKDPLQQAGGGFDTAKDQSRMGIRALTLLARTQAQLGELDAAQSNADRAVSEARSSLAGFGHSEWLGMRRMRSLAKRMVGRMIAKPASTLRRRTESWQSCKAKIPVCIDATRPGAGNTLRLSRLAG